MIDNTSKLYAAFCSGLVEVDAMASSYPIVANALQLAGLREFTEIEARRVLEKEFGELFPIGVVRQILDVGKRRNELQKRGERYVFSGDRRGDSTEQADLFEKKLKSLVCNYAEYCKRNKYPCGDAQEVRNRLIDSLDSIDADVLAHSHAADAMSEGKIDYSLYKFIEHCSQHDVETFKFICEVCKRNLVIESLLYAPQSVPNLKTLSVYLDTPIVYALLGLSDDVSNELYPRMVEELKKLGCRVQILDRNNQEIDQALLTTVDWAFGSKFTILEASQSARVMRKKWKSDVECKTAILEARKEMSKKGFVVCPTEYKRNEDRYQIDEKALTKRISAMYGERQDVDSSLARKIAVDTVAIGMVYRMRHGNIAYKMEFANHLLLTTNTTLANAAKQFERQMRRENRQAMSVPACVHVDLVATLLWVRDQNNLQRYHRERLLALCGQCVNPSRGVMVKFSEQLEKARTDGKISDETYVLLRCGAVVEGALMRTTQGKSENVNDKTVERVLMQISAQERQKFESQRARFAEQLVDAKKTTEKLKSENESLLASNEDLGREMSAHRENLMRIANSVSLWAARSVALLLAVLVGMVTYLVFSSGVAAIVFGVLALLFELSRIGSHWSLIGGLYRWLRKELGECLSK